MALSLAWKIFLAFCLVLGVVLGLGLWSLRATQQLHALNETLLTRAIPAVQGQLALAELVPTLARLETRAIILRDPAYQALHRDEAHAFQRQLEGLAGLLEGRDAQAALGLVQVLLAGYLARVDEEWAALGRGRAEAALRLSEGPTRQAADALRAALQALLAQSRADIERQVAAAGGVARSARLATGLSLAVSLAVGLGLAGLVAVRITRPIRALSHATQLVARGEYDVPLVVTNRDEVGELARAFRAMAQQLQHLERLKAQLLANISHDLRSPLSSIGAAASLLQAGRVSAKEARWLGIIQADSRKLLRLTNQILDLGKLRAGALQLNVTRANLRWIVESAAEELRPETEERGIRLAVILPDPPPPLDGDEDRLQQVLVNLLSNAVKFTPKGGRVTLTAREEGDEVILSVADTGVGIPAAQLPHIFDRYHQAHEGKGGTGLGLAIVKEFVEPHGGRVWAESREGEGSQFHVGLPRKGVLA